MKNCLFAIFILLILLFFMPSAKKYESFDVQFGKPPETSADDSDNMKELLEIGSQANENTQFDQVSTQYLGDISRPKPPPPPPPPPDPVCFQGKLNRKNPVELDDFDDQCC